MTRECAISWHLIAKPAFATLETMTNRLILYFHTAANAQSARKIEGASRAAEARRWSILRFDLPGEKTLAEIIGFWQPDAIVIDAVNAKPKLLVAPSLRKLPTVVIDGDPKTTPIDLPLVFQDPPATARAAADELSRYPMKSYVFAAWPDNPFWSRERGDAFVAAMREKGIAASIFLPAEKRLNRTSLVRHFARWLETLERPVGVFAAADPLAAQILEAAKIRGLEIPGEIAIVGVDNDEFFCENSRPTLSSVSTDFEAMGALAIEKLDAMLNRRKAAKPFRISFSKTLTVSRSSSRRNIKHDPTVVKALDLIRERAFSGLKSEEVLSLFSCSRRLAEMRFRAIAGRSILEEIHHVQVERAKSLIANPRQKLTLVPALCGHASTAFFQKLFLAETGLTMSAYRSSLLVGCKT